MGLGETCIFYANQSAVIRENLALVREVSMKGKKGGIDQKIGDQFLLTWSLWMNTLLSTLARLLILILTGLMVDSCIRNCMAIYIKHRINSCKLPLFKTNYVLINRMGQQFDSRA